MSTEVDNYLESMGMEVGSDLKHYGKKGMKWGVRNEDGGSGGGAVRGEARAARKAKRQAENDEIEGARERQRMRGIEIERQAFKTYTANGEKAVQAAVKKYDKMSADLLTNPDASTAMKMTSGEKLSAGIQWGVAAAGLAVYAGVKVNQMRR